MTAMDDLIATPAPAKTIGNPQHDERIILSNARRIASRRHKALPNWSLAMEIFGLGSTWAWALCERVNVDPEGKTMTEWRPTR